jgi:diguanylate cyclase (GGDEF)-like protein/PAS domain S-box-containing protein
MEQEMGNGWAEGVHPDDFARCLDIYVSHFDRRESFRIQYRLKHHSGEYRWIDDQGVPRFAGDQSFEGYIGSCIDIHESKLAEQKVSENEERWRFALEGAGDGIWDWNPTSNEVTFSKRWKEMIGYTEQELPNTVATWEEHLHPDEKDSVWASIQECFEYKNDYYRNEFRFRCKDGAWKWISSRGMVINRDMDGNPLRMIGTHTDISDRKNLERNLLNESEKNLTLLRNASDGIHILDLEGNVLQASDSFCQMLGYPLKEVIGMNVAQWDGTFAKSEIGSVIRQHFEQHQYVEFEAVHRRKDGTTFEVHISGNAQILNGQPVMFYSSRDISQRKTLEEGMRTLSTAVEQSPVSVVITDLKANIKFVNPRFTVVTGYTAEEAIGQNPRILQSGLTPKETHKELWDSLVKGRIWHGELANKRKNGELYWEECFISPVRNGTGVIKNYVATKIDITERKAMEEQIQQLAFYDPLTKLPNRRLLSDRLSQVMSASRRSGIYGAVIFLDLDNFKPVNDIHGQAIGDLLLVEAAMRLKSCVREMDTVARFGGDEFVIMLSELDTDKSDSISQAKGVAEKILALLSATYKIGIKSNEGYADRIVEHQCTASIGMAVFVNQQNSQEEIIGWADAAMYQAKESGRNQIRLYSE